MRVRPEEGTMFATSIPFSEYKTYGKYTRSVGRDGQRLPEYVQYEACRRGYRAQYRTRESVLHILEVIENSRPLK